MISIINELIHPDMLPDPAERISIVHTHISFVIIADNFVYKVKKPVNFGFLDFSTLEKRKYFCQREIDLNRRLSPDLYLEVLPVYFNGTGYRIGGDEDTGELIDYAVKMKRIPDDMLMKNLFSKGLLTNQHLLKISDKLAVFHMNANHSNEIAGYGAPDVFKINTDENFLQTEKYQDITISKTDFNEIKNWTDNFLKVNENIFNDRVSNKMIRDCHGDLHMEHICLTDSIPIFDCIEFNERFRYTDILADIAFLLMDLEYRGGKQFADILWEDYSRITDSSHMTQLLNFYKVYRAYVRGKVISFQLDDKNIDPTKKEESVSIANKYFQLAREYIS
jgi:uncharacterized protein